MQQMEQTVSKYTVSELAVFERKVFGRMCGGIKVNENWRKQSNKELIQQLEDLDTVPFVKIISLNWIGYVYKMDSKREVSQVFNTNPQGSRLTG